MDDQARVEQIIANIPRPDTVRRWEVRPGEDSTGDPAVWIRLTIDDVSDIPEKMDELDRFTAKIRSDVLDSDLKSWPYFKFIVPDEQYAE